MSEAFKQRSMKRKNVKGLALNAPPARAPSPSAGDSQIPGAIGNDASRHDTLEIGVEFKLDLRSEDLIVVKELGAGNGGTVSKVIHAATKVVMAKKVIHVEAKKEVRKQIVRELHIMHDCNSPYIVSFYGAFLNDAGDVIMCMEYMDCSSLDRISKDIGPIRVDVLGKIAEAVLGGLTYLYNVHRIMHRDIKPSNVLLNTRGHIKLCDFGMSGELVNSIANTFVGTSTYMAPERIQGAQYSVKSDVWSVGLTLMELAIGRFPFDSSDESADDRAIAGPTGILDLLQQIVHEPAPKLPKSDAFPRILEHMIEKCLLKNPEERPTPQELYDKDPFLKAAKRTPVDLQGWAISMMEKHNRKSHLAPQHSPATKALLRGEEDSGSSTSKETYGPHTPSSGEIPIAGDIKSSPLAGPIPLPPLSTPAETNGGGGGGATSGSASNRLHNPHPGYPIRTSSASTVPRSTQSGASGIAAHTNGVAAAPGASSLSPALSSARLSSTTSGSSALSAPVISGARLSPTATSGSSALSPPAVSSARLSPSTSSGSSALSPPAISGTRLSPTSATTNPGSGALSPSAIPGTRVSGGVSNLPLRPAPPPAGPLPPPPPPSRTPRVASLPAGQGNPQPHPHPQPHPQPQPQPQPPQQQPQPQPQPDAVGP